MGIFFGNKKKDKLILVFDIGSSSVGGALFYVQESKIPKIILSIREPIVFEEKIDIDQLLISTIKSLEIVAKKISTAGVGAPSDIFCILSSPWYVSQTRVISFVKNTPFIFTPKFSDSLIQKEISLFEQEHMAQYVGTKNAIRLIELKNIKIILNGYETPRPLNQKATEVEMTILVSMSPEQILKKIENTITRHFHGRQVIFSSFSMASFAVVRDLYSTQENFLLVDVGGEVTDISMVKKNILRELISFPLGRNFIIRSVASELKCDQSEAKSMISLFQAGHAEEGVAKKLGLFIGKLKAEWLRGFQESLVNISNDISIPSAIFISVDKDLSDFFCEIIKTEQFNQYTLTESKFEITSLNADIFHGMAVFDDNTIRDAELIIDSIYICRFLIKTQ